MKFADDVLVADMESQDGSAVLAKELGARVVSFKDQGFVEPVRNEGIKRAKHDWVLVLDADEEISDNLKLWLQSFASTINGKQHPINGYYLPRKNIIFGHEMQGTGWWPDYQLRFFHRDFISWSDRIHEPPTVRGQVEYLKVDSERMIVHHNYQSVGQYLDRLNHYSTIMAEQRGHLKECDAEKVMMVWKDELFRRWFIGDAAVDGGLGVSLGLLQATSELATLLKRWEKRKFEEPDNTLPFLDVIRRFQQDMNYWIADYQVKHSTVPSSLWWRIRRKLKI